MHGPMHAVVRRWNRRQKGLVLLTNRPHPGANKDKLEKSFRNSAGFLSEVLSIWQKCFIINEYVVYSHLSREMEEHL